MGVIFFDGFDHYTEISYKYTTQYGPQDDFGTVTVPAISSSAARHGSGGLLLRNGGMVYKAVPDSASLVVGVSFRFTTAPPSPGFKVLSFREEGVENAYLLLTSARRMSIVGANGTSLGATSTQFETERWYFIECAVTFSGSGTYIIGVDGKVDISGTGNFKKGANAYSNMVRFGYSNAGNYPFHYDDLYITDGILLGPCLVDNDAEINDTYPYTSSSASNSDERLAHASDVGDGGAVHAVAVHTLARKAYGNTRIIYNKIQIGGAGAAYSGSAHYLTTDLIYHSDIWERNPATAGTWTPTIVNAAKFGFGRQA